MAGAVEINDASFEAEVLKSDQPVLVDFSATWCGPCKQLTPIVDELADEYEGRVKVVKVDVDASQQVAGKYGIMSVPTVLFFNGGEPVETIVGLNAKTAYKSKIDTLLAG
jgi:thioredoxin 1